MNFGEALEIMKNGGKIKVPEWKGYWFRKNSCIWVHLEDGTEIQQNDMNWVNSVIWREDWQKL